MLQQVSALPSEPARSSTPSAARRSQGPHRSPPSPASTPPRPSSRPRPFPSPRPPSRDRPAPDSWRGTPGTFRRAGRALSEARSQRQIGRSVWGVRGTTKSVAGTRRSSLRGRRRSYGGREAALRERQSQHHLLIFATAWIGRTSGAACTPSGGLASSLDVLDERVCHIPHRVADRSRVDLELRMRRGGATGKVSSEE